MSGRGQSRYVVSGRFIEAPSRRCGSTGRTKSLKQREKERTKESLQRFNVRKVLGYSGYFCMCMRLIHMESLRNWCGYKGENGGTERKGLWQQLVGEFKRRFVGAAENFGAPVLLGE